MSKASGNSVEQPKQMSLELNTNKIAKSDLRFVVANVFVVV